MTVRGWWPWLRAVFAAFDIATGLVIAKTYKSHRAKEWIKFLEGVDKQVPRLTEPDEPGGEPHVLQIHVVADNYATHKTPTVQQWLGKHMRFNVHFTPTSSSWLNQVPVKRPIEDKLRSSRLAG